MKKRICPECGEIIFNSDKCNCENEAYIEGEDVFKYAREFDKKWKKNHETLPNK